MKKVLLVALLVLGLGLTAFAADKVTIEFWLGAFGASSLERVIEYFEAENPDVNVITEVIPGDIRQKTLMALAADAAPDVLFDYPGRTLVWGAQGFLEPLEDTLTDYDYEDFLPGMIELNSVDGHFVGYPCTMGHRSFSVVKNLFEQAGIVDLLPTGLGRNWSFESLMEAADAIKELGIYPFGFFANGASGDYWTLMWFQMFGASLYENSDYTRITLNSAAGVKALEWMVDMVDKGYAPKGVAGLTPDDYCAMRSRGDIAIGGWYRTPEQSQRNLDNGISDYLLEFYLTAVPHIEGVAPPPVYVAWNQVVVFKGQSPEKLDASKRLARFFGSKEFYELLAVPSHQPMRLSCGIDHLEPRALFLSELASVNGVGNLGYGSPFYTQVRDLQYNALQSAFMKLKTPKEALDDFAEAVAKLWEE